MRKERRKTVHSNLQGFELRDDEIIIKKARLDELVMTETRTNHYKEMMNILYKELQEIKNEKTNKTTAELP